MCDHQFSYAGVRYCDGTHSLPGGGAKRRYYAHVYFCTKCTQTKGDPIEDPGYREGRGCYWNSYSKPHSNAVPGKPSECGVPLEDAR